MSATNIVVIGLGYVGLPLAVALAAVDGHRVTGFDVDGGRIDQLSAGHDRTREVAPEVLAASAMRFTADPAGGRAADLYIVTVPTPVDALNQPDFSALLAASRSVAAMIDPALRPTVVFESTVFPGATEDICGPEIERAGALKRGRDFRLGYSPERINPGDRLHRVDTIAKVIAGEDDEVADMLAAIYGAMTTGGIFRAASIKAAEAAKAIENAQRDINIAFVNEVAQILARIDVSVWDVLAAARTKWNFLPFEPGLVGGHCIGVDPYYLSALATRLGHHPQVILAGRETNDGMGRWIADRLHAEVGAVPGRALVMGMTFKENVPDLRNSRSIDLVRRLAELGHQVTVTDPMVDAAELAVEFPGVATDVDGPPFALVVLAVAHDAYRADLAAVAARVAAGGLLADIKGMARGADLAGVRRWSL